MVPDPQGVGHGRQRRIDRADAGEEGRVHDVEVVQVVRLAVDVQRRCGGVRAEPDGAGLVGGGPDGHPLVQVDAVRQQPVLVHSQVPEHLLQLVPETLEARDVVLLVQSQVDAAVLVEGDAAVGQRQILPAQPEVHRVVGEDLERHVGRDHAGPARRLAVDLVGVRLAEHLDAAERVVPVVGAQIPVVQGQRLLEPGGVRLLRHGHQRHVVVPHVVAPHDVRAVGQPPGMPVVCRTQQQHRGVHRATGDHHDVTAERFRRAVRELCDHTGHGAACRVGLQALDVGVGHHRDVVVFEGGVDADHLRVGLRAHQAREPVDPVAADADAGVRRPAVPVLGEVHADRQMERVQAPLLQVVAELLDARLVLHRGMGVLAARRAFGGVLAVPSVDQIELLGLRVVRLQVLVADRPRRGDPVVVAELPEVLRPQAEQGGAVELGVPADVVVDLRREPLAVLVVPELRGPVLARDEHRGGIPVVPLPRQVVAAFEDQDPLAAGGQTVGEGSAARSAADDDDVVVVIAGHTKAPFWSRGLPWSGHRPAPPGDRSDSYLTKGDIDPELQAIGRAGSRRAGGRGPGRSSPDRPQGGRRLVDDRLRGLLRVHGQAGLVGPQRFQVGVLGVHERGGHEVPRAPGDPPAGCRLTNRQMQEPDSRPRSAEHLAILVPERRARHDSPAAGRRHLPDPPGQVLQPGPAILLGQRPAGGHRGAVRRRMEIVRLQEGHLKPLGEKRPYGGLPAPRDAHDHDDRRHRSAVAHAVPPC
ncbi:hypothetical protein SCOCK_10070 [Actinacidiphila cocklensis]|uniref:Uncharacterized protein n=1 Tax=Actinacidiphila cocklensis TaxID=887465 RepID=A0A9W4DIZ9_9ACTN|nr:hypothetical protein SCOCK_10070 [Actinacidiphila cocklensis]